MNSLVRPTAVQADISRPDRRRNADSTIDFYDRNAGDYARTTRSISLSAEIQEFCTLLRLGATVLDVGCGGGRDLLALRRSGMEPIGLELSAKLAKIARNYSDCPVIIADMRCPPFADASFDAVWAAASLLHLEREQVLPTLRQLRRLLKGGGAFFASMKVGTATERSADGRLFSYFMPDEWLALLTSAGFTEVQIRTEVRTSMPAGDTAWLQSLSRAP